MTDRNVVTISVIEYDMPTHTSHIGIHVIAFDRPSRQPFSLVLNRGLEQ